MDGPTKKLDIRCDLAEKRFELLSSKSVFSELSVRPVMNDHIGATLCQQNGGCRTNTTPSTPGDECGLASKVRGFVVHLGYRSNSANRHDRVWQQVQRPQYVINNRTFGITLREKAPFDRLQRSAGLRRKRSGGISEQRPGS